MPWLAFVPEAPYWGIRLVGEAPGCPDLPVFISENGCADGSLANSPTLERTPKLSYCGYQEVIRAGRVV